MIRLTDFLQVQASRRKHGLRDPGQALHFVFKGNPGTGKTTVARIIGRLLHGFGFLKTDNFVECGRSDLVGGYLGQTALKTDEKVRQALDGVLFVDEAYTLARERDDDSYGHEAIDTLLKRMEDFRDRLTVIVAGYPRLMDEFTNSNPGLKSRFTRFLYFEDYTADELIKIFEKFCNDSHYVPDAGCRQAMSSLFNLAYRERDETFGNARYVRNVFEDVVNRHSQRLTASGKISDRAELMRLDALDVPLNEALIGLGKRRGFVSHGQLVAVLPDDCSDEVMRALLDLLEAHGVEVLSDDEAAGRTRQAAATESRRSELPD
jgi:SpoVK/Ycf46/Vps4 family AAA+-type ATPase